MTEINTSRTNLGPELRRYRVNPVEIVILLTIAGVFLNSAYDLFYSSQGFHPAALKPMAANPVSEGRSPASITSSFLSADVACGTNTDRETSASKIRLSGPLCGTDHSAEHQESDPLLRATVLNEANQFSATVFTDAASGKFSTDYIPLSAGKNQIKVEFSYKSGKVISQDVAFNKF